MAIKKTPGGCFEVTLRINGKIAHMGIFDKLEDAKRDEAFYKRCRKNFQTKPQVFSGEISVSLAAVVTE